MTLFRSLPAAVALAASALVAPLAVAQPDPAAKSALEASAAAARMVGADLDTVKNVAATAARRASGRPGDGAS